SPGLFLTGGRSTITRWDRTDPNHPVVVGSPIPAPANPDPKGWTALSVSPDGRTVASTGLPFSQYLPVGSMVDVWDLETGVHRWGPLPGRFAAFTPTASSSRPCDRVRSRSSMPQPARKWAFP